MKISVLTPTIRLNGLDVVNKALSNQSFKEFEWIVGSKENPNYPEAVWVKDDFEGGFWSLNRIYNKMFKQARGELIVSWQDWIYAKPDALEKFWNNYEKTKAVISGVGDQYESVDKWGKPTIKIWSDPRKTDKYGTFYECFPQDAEWNFCAFSKEAIYKVGGMDEHLDFLGYGGDQLQVGARMDEAGYKFYLDQTNESFTVRHGRENFGSQEEWDSKHVLFNGKYQERMEQLKRENKWPDVAYLK